MPISAQNLLSSNPPSHLCFHSHSQILPTSLKTPILSIKLPLKLSHFNILTYKQSPNHKFDSFPTHQWQLRVYESNGTVEREGLDKFNWEVLLSVAEILCLIPSAILLIGCVVNWTILNSQKSIQLNKFLVWQLGLLVASVVIGNLARRNQWRRVSDSSLHSSVSKLDLFGRIEKLEEDLKSLTTIVRMLSRQLEKLSIRFRVTRKSLKEPISEATALATRNSEATQALEMQKDILEKELGEMQKVLLAMQEQQEKQLDLILAVAKAGKLTESKNESATESKRQHLNSAPVKEEKQVKTQIKTGGRQKIANNDSP